MAARPKTLTGAAAPVLIGVAAALDAGRFNAVPAVLCLLFAFLMQIDANFINDYFDFKSGIDSQNTLGPQRACIEGLISMRTLRIVIAFTTIIACIIGLPLMIYGGWSMIIIGIFCLIFCFLYTTWMSKKGMGDLLVVIFFGLVPVCTTYYIQVQTITVSVAAVSLACGLVIDCLLIVNNYRDRDTDKLNGKLTLVTKIGAEATEKLYLYLGIIAVLLCQALWFENKPAAALIPILFLFLHISSWRKLVRIKKGKELNKMLGETARNIIIFALLLSIGYIL